MIYTLVWVGESIDFLPVGLVVLSWLDTCLWLLVEHSMRQDMYMSAMHLRILLLPKVNATWSFNRWFSCINVGLTCSTTSSLTTNSFRPDLRLRRQLRNYQLYIVIRDDQLLVMVIYVVLFKHHVQHHFSVTEKSWNTMRCPVRDTEMNCEALTPVHVSAAVSLSSEPIFLHVRSICSYLSKLARLCGLDWDLFPQIEALLLSLYSLST